MINPKKIAAIAKRLARRRTGESTLDDESCATSVAERGHFVAYTTDGARFMVPLEYLGSKVLPELLKIAENEFGVARDRPILLPCDSMFMEFVMCLLRRGGSEEVERALLDSLPISSQSNCSMALVGQSQQISIVGF